MYTALFPLKVRISLHIWYNSAPSVMPRSLRSVSLPPVQLQEPFRLVSTQPFARGWQQAELNFKHCVSLPLLGDKMVNVVVRFRCERRRKDGGVGMPGGKRPLHMQDRRDAHMQRFGYLLG